MYMYVGECTYTCMRSLSPSVGGEMDSIWLKSADYRNVSLYTAYGYE